ncbi:hypothetical protein [Aliidiomarina quisquiliarum]|uniref:hypothetical protein n=1 Tax=Aliidiomarina quisquiliarum TaxID=2938947 RepID=UPI00208FB176|nr:hypothetical protein [Aliidiomarina quisquiliarum]MCO4319978.1 hypothetical protein [Aliidiomarina quisquiliarum]
MDILRVYPQLEPVVAALSNVIPVQRKYLGLSVWSQVFEPMDTTCSDDGWHLDGRMNPDSPDYYGLICFGADGFRTMFYKGVVSAELPDTLPTTPESRRAYFQKALAHDLSDESFGFEIPNATPVGYSTFDFHKGRVAPQGGTRLFVRLAASDFIRPKRIRL